MKTRIAFLLPAMLLGALTLVTPQRARADAQQQQSFAVWAQMQNCARQAFKQYPDYTAEGNAKREAAREECLRAHRLPVSAPSPGAH